MIPQQLCQEGIRFVLVEKGKKKPFQNGWQNKNIKWNDLELTKYLEVGGNYGVMGGGEKNLLIVDFDDKKVQEELITKLPPTLTIRTGSGMLHKYFFSDEAISFKIFDKDMNTLIDVQGEGKQAVGPGSIHPNGNKYEIVENKDIAFVSHAELKAIIMPYDKKPIRKMEEKHIEKPKTQNKDEFLDKLLSSTSMVKVLESIGVNTSKNPTSCPFHSSKGGKCLSFTDKVAHCFHCEGKWNCLSLVKEVKKIGSKEAIQFLAEFSGLTAELEESRKKFLDEKKKEIEEIHSKVKIQVILPKTGKLVSTFAEELAVELAKENSIFYRIDTREIVEVGEVKDKDNENIIFQGFKAVRPNRFITLVEQSVVPGIEMYNEDTKQTEFHKKSMNSAIAQTVLESQSMQEKLPKINRIFTVPLPILHDGVLTFPKKGYDPRFKSWLVHDAPDISDTEMSLNNAKEILEELYNEFPFATAEDKTRAIAALLTPFLRGLFPRFTVRTPVAAYKANRERAGKDYCAGITGIVYHGDALEDSPIEDDNELRKKLCAGLMEGRKRFHFSNNKGHINSSSFEGIITAEHWSDRVLGKSENVTIANEIDFSLSGNIGISFTPDLVNRCIFINLFLAVEDANSRKFENPALHTFVKENRGRILSSLFALIRNWIDTGKKPGSVPFASFPDWAKICGGVMEAAGYSNPAVPDKEKASMNVDHETSDMKVLFELGYAHSLTSAVQAHSGGWLARNELIALVQNEDAFAYYDFTRREDQTKFGMKLSKFIGRYLSGIRMEVDNPGQRASRHKYRFVKDLI